MRFIAALDTTIYGRAYAQGAAVDTSEWSRKQLLQFLNNGIIAPADITTEDLNAALADTTLDQIGDVDTSGAQEGSALVRHGSIWVAREISSSKPLYDTGNTGIQSPDGTWRTVATTPVLGEGMWALSAHISHTGDHSMAVRIYRDDEVPVYPYNASASEAGSTRAPEGVTGVWEWNLGGRAGIGNFSYSLRWAGTGSDVYLKTAMLIATPLG